MDIGFIINQLEPGKWIKEDFLFVCSAICRNPVINITVTQIDKEVLLNGFSKDWPYEILSYTFNKENPAIHATSKSSAKNNSQVPAEDLKNPKKPSYYLNQVKSKNEYRSGSADEYLNKTNLKRFFNMSSKNIGELASISDTNEQDAGKNRFLEIRFQKVSFETHIYATPSASIYETKEDLEKIKKDANPLLAEYFSKRAKGYSSDIAGLDMSKYTAVRTEM